ncbi:MAG: 1-acyl-sn-glycerol-3-phosphate acyltransferase [Myxococcales bacterium]|nr:1-acyl-sn-glycerol-3-phosphate acyltransferase [Myxococcales bacterium]USN51202.1 MAG: 1-acyl-sn-glycerol-3-phosphate acyltransferase [Myxococcales bacterium]
MKEKLLLFKPKHPAQFKKSSWYGVVMFVKTFALCSQYLARALAGKVNVPITDNYLRRFWQIQFKETFSTLFVTGRKFLKPNHTYLFMSNHESWLDIPAMFAAVPMSLRMVSKAGIMSIPVVGPAMEKAGFIAVDRKNRSKAIRQLELAKKRLNDGISIWMAPEGTRSRTGEIAHFKKGGFHLATSLGLDIVPVFIEGARDIMPADTLMINSNRSMTVHFCEPVSTKGVDKSSMNDLMEKVRTAIILKKQQVKAIHDDESAL